MNKPVWLARLLTVGGVIEIAAGLGLLVDPAGAALNLFGSPIEAPGAFLGRIGGAGLLALGIACWGARKTPLAPASLAVAWAFLAYNAIACLTLAWAVATFGREAFLALAGALLHGVLAAATLAALLARGPTPPTG